MSQNFKKCREWRVRQEAFFYARDRQRVAIVDLRIYKMVKKLYNGIKTSESFRSGSKKTEWSDELFLLRDRKNR
jgi:hypothetical protein